MKRIISTLALFAASTFASVPGALAQDHSAKATIPFDFTVNDQLLAPGTYIISYSPTWHQVKVQSKDGGSTVVAISFANDKSSPHQAKLVFDKIGDQYFLTEVVSTSASGSAVLPKSKLEQKATMVRAELHSPSTVTVAMR
jgi:hypothetical protein